jgi:hypothetical protein
MADNELDIDELSAGRFLAEPLHLEGRSFHVLRKRLVRTPEPPWCQPSRTSAKRS